MPWDYKTNKPDSVKYLNPSIQKKAIAIANAILRNGGDEGTAIAVGIKKAKEQYLEKTAMNFKQAIRPFQRHKTAIIQDMVGGATIGAIPGAVIGARTTLDRDSNGRVQFDKNWNVKRKPGTSVGKRTLIGAAIGGLAGATLGGSASFNRFKKMDKRQLGYSKENKNFNNRWRDTFKGKQRSGYDDYFKKQHNDDFFNDFFEHFGEKGNSGTKKDSWYYRMPPPPPPPSPPSFKKQAADISGFFKEHGGISHVQIKTKKQAKQIYREAARKHHPDMGGNPEKFKELSSHWEAIENDPWFTKLASLSGLIKLASMSNDDVYVKAFTKRMVGKDDGNMDDVTAANKGAKKVLDKYRNMVKRVKIKRGLIGAAIGAGLAGVGLAYKKYKDKKNGSN